MGREAAAWALLAAASAGLCWAAWTLPPRADPPPPPAPLPRPASLEEQAQVQNQLAALQASIQAAAERRGAPLPLAELESADPTGRPWLPEGLPDNPLRPGVAGVIGRCPAEARPEDEADWIYCEADGGVDAVGLNPG